MLTSRRTSPRALRLDGVYARLFQMQWRDGEDLVSALSVLQGALPTA